MFSIDRLRGAVLVEKEICILATKDEAIAAAMTRATDVAKRHSGREPDGFRLTDANGRILAIVSLPDCVITKTLVPRTNVLLPAAKS